MASETGPDEIQVAKSDPESIVRRLDDLAGQVAELTRVVQASLRSSTRTFEATTRRLVELEVRVGDDERRVETISKLIRLHEKTIGMMCSILKDLDDPYGLGTSLDGQLGLDDSPSNWDERDGPRYLSE